MITASDGDASSAAGGSSRDLGPLLAIDTSGDGAGLVVVAGGVTDSALLPATGAGAARTEDLAAEAARLLSRRGLAPRDLAVLGAVVGPGSYTGLRSGLAFLRGLAFGGRRRGVAVGSLELLAWRSARRGELVAACWPATEGRLLAGAWSRDDDDVVERAAPRILAGTEDVEDFRKVLRELAPVSALAAGGGEAARALAGALALELRVAGGDALAALAALVAARARRGADGEIDAMLPLYVGQSTARPNRNRVALAGVPE